jgi:hypothetical protein
MSVYLHVTLEVHAAGMRKFIATMAEIVPIVEGAGWKLVGAYVQRTGRLNTVIDLWELEDYNHYGRGTSAIGNHPRARELVAALSETVQSETIVFADKAPYSH